MSGMDEELSGEIVCSAAVVVSLLGLVPKGDNVAHYSSCGCIVELTGGSVTDVRSPVYHKIFVDF